MRGTKTIKVWQVGDKAIYNYVDFLGASNPELKERSNQEVEIIEIDINKKTPWKYKIRFSDGFEECVARSELE